MTVYFSERCCMGFKFSSLNKRADENLLQFDNRISQMFPVVAGTVYFAMENYNPYTGEFGIYIEWDSEINERLNDRLPSGGYFVKATNGQALSFARLSDGIPVYMKLICNKGRIYPYRTFILWEGRPYSVEFNGNILIPFEDKIKMLTDEKSGSQGRDLQGGSQRKILLGGSQRKLRLGSQRYLLSGSQGRMLLGGSQRFLFGSQRYWSHEWEWEYRTGSQRHLFGSYQGLYGYNFGSGWRYLYGGSQSFSFGSNRGIYSFGLGGSQRIFLFGGSQRNWTHEWEWKYETGSQRSLFGSNRGLYALSGSQRSLIAGSNRGLYTFGGSQRYLFGSNRGLYNFGSNRAWTGDVTPDITDIPYWRYVPKEWQLINKSRRPKTKKGGNGKLGYGLDLI